MKLSITMQILSTKLLRQENVIRSFMVLVQQNAMTKERSLTLQRTDNIMK